MRRGKVYRRCTRCGGDVNAERRAADRPTKHERCEGDRATWAYTVDVARPGAPRKQVTRAGFATKREALAALAELQVQADRHGYSEPSRLTLGEYAASWLPAYMGRVRPGTAAAVEYHMRLHVVPQLGSVPLQALDRQTVKAFYARLGKEGSSTLRLRTGCSPRSGCWRTAGCVAASCSDCAGATWTSTPPR